jgi:hypothetical protein
MPVVRRKGAAKNLVLTAWLVLPLAMVAGVTWYVVAMYSKPKVMNAPAVGAGAGDTGGANALGERLAGRDPDAVRREKRAEAQEAREQHAPEPDAEDAEVTQPDG